MTDGKEKEGRFAVFVPTIYEARPFIKALSAQKTFEDEDLIVFESKIHDLLIPISGAGPKNAIKAYHVLNKIHKIRAILLSGIAGALDPSLKIGNWVLVQGFQRWKEEGEIRIGANRFETNSNYTNKISEIVDKVKAISKYGDIVTGDRFVCDSRHKKELFELTKAVLVDMEAYELASLARNDDIPFFCIKVVSDLRKENVNLNFSKFMGRFGDINSGRALRYVFKNPGKIPEFLRISKNSRKVTASLFELARSMKQAS